MKLDLIIRAFIIALLFIPHSHEPTWLIWMKGTGCILWLVIAVLEVIQYRRAVVMKRKYKISIDDTGYYNVFYSFKWFPMWIKSNGTYTRFRTIEDAKEYINKLKNPVYL